MLDLKSKLLAAGLVTQEQVDKATVKPPKSIAQNHKSNAAKNESNFEQYQRQKQLNELKNLPKSEQYDLIRKWVNHNRLDVVSGLPSENAQKFFFQKSDKNISWLTLEPNLYEQIKEGTAGIMAFMSHHGLTHCVMPRDIVEDVAEVFPEWLRVLKGHRLEPQTNSPDATNC